MTAATRPEGPDLSRRDFVKAVAATAALVTVAPGIGQDRGPGPSGAAVERLHASLTDDQRAQICFPFDHPLRSRVRANWAVVKPRIDDLGPAQKSLCREIFEGFCSDDGLRRFLRQMGEDYGGFGRYHIALFGDPGTDSPSEWVITGRHVTLRTGAPESSCGPIFYGHASESFREDVMRTGNVWGHQAERAHALFKALDPAQIFQARNGASNHSSFPPYQGGTEVGHEPAGAEGKAAPSNSPLARGRVRLDVHSGIGLPVRDLDGPQKALVQGLLAGLLQPFRSFPAEAIRSCLRDTDSLRLTGFRDVWALEGPGFSWFFHGTPHVHAWLDVGVTATRSGLNRPVPGESGDERGVIG